jgi:hypothetical protein
MAEDRGMVIHFNDGSNMRLSFPKQVKSDESVSVRLERMLDHDSLLVETDGALLLIPRSSIKYLQVYPAPAKLPDYVIKEATIVA